MNPVSQRKHRTVTDAHSAQITDIGTVVDDLATHYASFTKAATANLDRHEAAVTRLDAELTRLDLERQRFLTQPFVARLRWLVTGR